MPIHEPDPQDPVALHGVEVPDPDGASLRAMAECFVEEYLRLGFPPERVLALFRTPAYPLAHRAWTALGAGAVSEIVDEQARLWQGLRSPVPGEAGE